MKRINYITTILLSISCLSFIGCTVNEVEDIYSGFPYIELEVDGISIPKTTQTVEIPIKTNRDLRFKTTSNTDSKEWLKASLSEDGTSLQITAQANNLETTRSVVLILSTANDLVKKEIKVSQDASGELTISGDLILKSHKEILDNTYTKTRSALILGNVSNVTKASEGIQCGDYNIMVDESDIVDESVDTVTKRINQIAGRTLIMARTKVTGFPTELIRKNSIHKVYLDYNAISAIPSSDELQAMALLELSLKGNRLSDISSLAGCTTLTHLDISYNDIYTLDALDGLTGLNSLDVSGLPVSRSQIEVFAESHPEWVIRSSSLREESSKFTVMDKTDINLISATEASLTTKVLYNNGGTVKEAGYYIGKSPDLKKMTKHIGTYTSGTGTITLTYDNGKEFADEMYIRSYAINEAGIGYGPRGRLGDPHKYGNAFLKSESEIATFYHDNYLYVDGSLVIGTSDISGNIAQGDIQLSLNDGTRKWLKPSDIADISLLSKVLTIRDGLYIGNTQTEDFSVVSGIQSTPKMWLNANRMSAIPNLGNVDGLKELNLSRNIISDFSPLLGLTGLETLYLGFSETPDLESNDIGVLTGLEKMTGLKYLDLSGLPIIAKQVKDLEQLMPNCTIVFNPSDRPAYLPTVRTGNITKGDGCVTLNSTLVYNGKTNVTEYGFYIGKDLNAMEKVPVGSNLDDQTIFSYEFRAEDESDFYFYPYAVNSIGEGTDISYKKFNIFSNNLSQYGTSNCYIVPEAGTYSFDASVKGNSTESVGTIASVEVLWETDKANVKASTGHVISDIVLQGSDVTITTTGQEGNALVAVKDAADIILWSWHIWSTDTPVDQHYINNSGDFYVLDRNIGATRSDRGTGDEWKECSGLLYEWGRKDPFADGHYKLEHAQFTLKESIEKPTNYAGRSTPWTSEWSETLWSDEKTIYDPCPVGYKVSSKDVWSGFTTTGGNANNVSAINAKGEFDYGWNFYIDGQNTAWYPVNPHIGFNGNFEYHDDRGHGWCTTPSFIIEYLISKVVFQSTSSYQAFPVRCMREHDINVNLSTAEVHDVTKTTATVSGAIEYLGKVNLTELGFVYSSSTDSPNVNSSKITTPITEGNFSKTLTGLKPGTTYYVCTYAAEGDTIIYGNVLTFTTPMGGGTEGLPEDDYEWE